MDAFDQMIQQDLNGGKPPKRGLLARVLGVFSSKVPPEKSQRIKEEVKRNTQLIAHEIKETSSVVGQDVKEKSKVLGDALGKHSKRLKDQINEKYIEGTALEQHLVKVDHALAFMTNSNHQSGNEAVDYANRPIRVGLWLFAVLVGTLFFWSVIAQLDSAAVAPGTVVLNANKKTVQHLEGGIIAELLVKEGDAVETGQPLIRLNETNAKARRDIVLSQYRATKALEARLQAERDRKELLEFPKSLTDAQDEEINKIMSAQTLIFETRRKAFEGKIGVLGQRTGQLKDEIVGLESQLQSSDTQLRLINEEIETVSKLLIAGHEQKPRLLALQRKAAELEGARGEYTARIARSHQQIAENELEIINLKNGFLNEVLTELRDTQVTLADLEERLRASEDILERIVITAPQSGVVNDLRFHTVGGVISPGEKIMDVVPQDDQLVIDAKVSLQDIDVVHVGLEAQVQLSAFKARRVPYLNGKVVNVSADTFVDQTTNAAYYVARIQIDEEMLAKLREDKVELYPGMAANVFIVTGKKSFMSYLLDPITDSMHHAFREG